MITECQIAFMHKGKPIARETFNVDTPQVMDKIRAAVLNGVSDEKLINGGFMLKYKRSDGSRAELVSDADVKAMFADCISGSVIVRVSALHKRGGRKMRIADQAALELKDETECSFEEVDAQDHPVESKVAHKKFDWRAQRAIHQAKSGQEIKDDSSLDSKESGVLTAPLKNFVDASALESLISVLEFINSNESAAQEVSKVIEISVEKKRSLKRFIHALGRIKTMKDLFKTEWIVPDELCAIYDDWIEKAEPAAAKELVMKTVFMLVGRRSKLMKDVHEKEKSVSKILKIRLSKKSMIPKVRIHDLATEKDVEKDFVFVKATKVESDVLENGKAELKMQRKQPRLAKALEKSGFATVEAMKQAKLAEELIKYGCANEEELKIAKKAARTEKQLKKFGCASVEELSELKKDAKLKKYGVSSYEELKQAKLAMRLLKYGCENEEELKIAKKNARVAKQLEKFGCQSVEELKEKKKALRRNRI